MKKVFILIIAISLFTILSKTKAMINEYEEKSFLDLNTLHLNIIVLKPMENF
ncbi:hypothetical protein ACQKII_17710 [Lysinibacillus sp. NPDC048646]|uniref:hypothetical protein n=1 Tax=Lysinibacillus sp. NPDC048646 TaxID=3390574 RepID=UPI003CFC1B4B